MKDMILDQSLLIREGSIDDSISDNKVFYRGDISDTSLDSYYTELDPVALEKVANFANERIRVLAEHEGPPIGRCVSASYNPVDQKVTSDFYIQTGLQLPALSRGYADSDSYAKSMNERTITGLSISFVPTDMECLKCNTPMKPDKYFGWHYPKCSKGHYPGKKLTDKQGRSLGIATGRVKDIKEVPEFSVVSDPSNKNAKIIEQARSAAKDGALTDERLEYLQTNYNLTRSDLKLDRDNLKGVKQMAKDKDLKDEDLKDEDQDQDQPEGGSTEVMDLRAEVRKLRRENEEFRGFIAEYEEETEDRVDTIQRLRDEVEEIKALRADKKSLEEDLEDRDGEIEKLQERIERNRKVEDNAARYEEMIEDARDEYMRAYIRARGIKTSSDTAAAERRRIDKNENYDLITAKTRKLRMEYQEETKSVKERRREDRRQSDSALYDI